MLRLFDKLGTTWQIKNLKTFAVLVYGHVYIILYLEAKIKLPIF